jgi:SAM-dependent methyltransferase
MAGVLDQVAEYYSKKLRLHGTTPKGVNWTSAESQERRFAELLRVCRDDRTGSFIDYGCGYGALARYLRREGYHGAYVGYDISRDLVTAAADIQSELERTRFTSNQSDLPRAAYTLASGLFHVRLDIPTEAWERHVRETIDHMAEISSRGFAFNMLAARVGSAGSGELYNADPARWLNHCLRRFPRRVTLAHDYPLNEFTIMIRGAVT